MLFHTTFLGRFICHLEKIITGKEFSLLLREKFAGASRWELLGHLLLLTSQETSPLLQGYTFTYLNFHLLGSSGYISDIQGVFQNMKQYFRDFE